MNLVPQQAQPVLNLAQKRVFLLVHQELYRPQQVYHLLRVARYLLCLVVALLQQVSAYLLQSIYLAAVHHRLPAFIQAILLAHPVVIQV